MGVVSVDVGVEGPCVDDQSARWDDLQGQDLLDPLRDVIAAAASARCGVEETASARPQVLLERRTSDVGDRHSTPLSLMAKSGGEVIRKLHSGSAHGDARIPWQV